MTAANIMFFVLLVAKYTLFLTNPIWTSK